MSTAKSKKKKRKVFLEEISKKPKRKIGYEHLSQEEIANFKKLIKHDETIFDNFTNNPETSILIGFDEVGRGCVAGPVCTGAYSCSSFYINTSELFMEVKRARELICSQHLDYSAKDLYNSATLVNEEDVEDSFQELSDLSNLLLLEDSKKVAHIKRENLCKALLDVPNLSDDFHIFYATNFQSAQNIDQNGIVQCIWTSMAENLLSIVIDYINIKNKYPEEVILLIDGPKAIPELTTSLGNLIKEKNIRDLFFIEESINCKQQSLDIKSDTKNFIKLKQISIVKGDSKSALIASASNIAKLNRDAYMKNIEDKFGYGWNKNAGYGTKKHFEAIEKFGISKYHRKSFLGNLAITEIN
jgi:ribonuclease HII